MVWPLRKQVLYKHVLLVTSKKFFKNIDKQNVLVKQCLLWWPNGQACLTSKVTNVWQTMFVCLAGALVLRLTNSNWGMVRNTVK